MAKALVLSTKAEAEERAERIRTAVEGLAELLAEAQESEDWRALGYDSWSAYIAGEFTISRMQSYRLVDKGKAIRMLTEALGEPPKKVTQADAKAIKQHPEIIEEVKAAPPPQRSTAYEAALLKQREIGEVRAPILKPSGKGGMRGGDPTEKLRRIMAEVEELARQAEEADEIPPQVQAFFEKLYTISFDFVSV